MRLAPTFYWNYVYVFIIFRGINGATGLASLPTCYNSNAGPSRRPRESYWLGAEPSRSRTLSGSELYLNRRWQRDGGRLTSFAGATIGSWSYAASSSVHVRAPPSAYRRRSLTGS